MSSTAQIISNKDFNDFTTQGRGILIFTVSWCKSALMMSIIFDKLAEKYKGKLNFAKVDVENFKEVNKLVKVGAVPEFLIWKEGKIFDRSHITRADELETFISKFCEKEAFEEEFDRSEQSSANYRIILLTNGLALF